GKGGGGGGWGGRRVASAGSAASSTGFRSPTAWPSWWASFSPPREHGCSADQRTAERRPGNPGTDCQGADRQKGRAYHEPHRPAGTVSRVHADGESHRRFTENFLGRRAFASKAAYSERTRERARRFYRADGGAGSVGR